MTVRCPSNGRSASSTSGLLTPAAQSSAGRAACSCLPWPAVLPRRPHRPHTTPTAGQAIPPLTHTPCYSAATAASRRSRTSEPSYSSLRGLPLSRLPRLRIVPFLGLTVVHRRGALRAAWSTWSRNDFHRKSTVRGEADSWVHGHSPISFVICQVSRFVRPVGLQIFQDEESFHSAGQENGPSVMRNGLYIFKTHQTGN